MADVRLGVDILDETIVSLLGERFRYMAAAARIKPAREAVRDEARKAQVIDNARQMASQAGIPGPVIAELYELLVEASIAHELHCLDRVQMSAGK